MKTQLIKYILVLALFELAGCSKVSNDKHASNNIDSTTSASATGFNNIAAKVETGTVLFAVVFGNGNIIPFAQWDSADRYSNPWSPSTYSEDTILSAKPEIKVPKTWFLYSMDGKTQGLQFEVDSLGLLEIQCYRNWSYSTNLFAVSPKLNKKDSWRIGFASTVSLLPVSSAELVQMESNLKIIRQQLNMLPSGTPGFEGAYSYEVLGYFHIRNKLFGIGISLPWESEQYELFEIHQGYGKKLIQFYGGGC